MDVNKVKIENLWVVVVTSLLTFIVAFFAFFSIRTLNPEFAIKFGRDSVKYENIKKFDDVRQIIKNNYYKDVPDDKLLEGAITGMADSLGDPYTVYYTKEQMKSFKEKSEGSYCGVGFAVNSDNGVLSVIDTFEDSPAKKAGIVSGDKIIKVDDVDVLSIKSEDVVINMIKGLENTKVKITVYRQSEEKSIDFEMIRKIIKIENITSEVINGKLGYIKLVMFDSDLSTAFNDHLKKLIEKDIKGLIIDVRDNPGGSYKEVVNICDRLLPKALIVYTQDKVGKRKEELSDANDFPMPIVVLTNGDSASASEILAGSLKDNNKAMIIGTKTYGKGLVQTMEEFDDGSGIKYTIAKYFTPSGEVIDKVGIKPDIEVKFEGKYQDYPVSKIPRVDDVQLNKAIEQIGIQIKN